MRVAREFIKVKTRIPPLASLLDLHVVSVALHLGYDAPRSFIRWTLSPVAPAFLLSWCGVSQSLCHASEVLVIKHSIKWSAPRPRSWLIAKQWSSTINYQRFEHAIILRDGIAAIWRSWNGDWVAVIVWRYIWIIKFLMVTFRNVNLSPSWALILLILFDSKIKKIKCTLSDRNI